jgi:hypothetical protein
MFANMQNYKIIRITNLQDYKLHVLTCKFQIYKIKNFSIYNIKNIKIASTCS